MRRYIKARLVLLLTALVAGLADIGSVKIMEPVHLTPGSTTNPFNGGVLLICPH